MYLPRHFEAADPQAPWALVRDFPLGTWIQQVDGRLDVQHLPFLHRPGETGYGRLIGHVARANPAWRHAGAGMVVFQGPQGYVTPSWYPGKVVDGRVVPTWNYAVVHLHGQARAIEDREALREIVTALTARFEAPRAQPWQVADAPDDYIDRMLGAIVGIEFAVDHVEAKFKLSQNRTPADAHAVREGLAAAPETAALAAWMTPRPPDAAS